MSGHRQDSRRHRRDGSPSHYRRESRRSSPGPSRGRSPPSRSDRQLPEQFGRVPEKREEDDSTVLQCMKRSFVYNPLGCLTKCIGGPQKLKVWTRNYKEVRGICTGHVIAFDKHWNLVLSDVKEVYLKPRKCKTPYLSDMKSGENLPELPPKTPKEKKAVAAEGDVPLPTSNVEAPPAVAVAGGSGEKEKKKKKKKRKKKTAQAANRFMKQCFVRGDNIVMVAIINESEPTEEEIEDDSLASKETSNK